MLGETAVPRETAVPIGRGTVAGGRRGRGRRGQYRGRGRGQTLSAAAVNPNYGRSVLRKTYSPRQNLPKPPPAAAGSLPHQSELLETTVNGPLNMPSLTSSEEDALQKRNQVPLDDRRGQSLQLRRQRKTTSPRDVGRKGAELPAKEFNQLRDKIDGNFLFL